MNAPPILGGPAKRPSVFHPLAARRGGGFRSGSRKYPYLAWGHTRCESSRLAASAAGVIKEGENVRFGFHNFRHSLATAPVKLKVDAKTVQGMLRHEDLGTTMQIYAQSDMKSMRDAQGKFLEQLLGDRIHLLTEKVQ